MNMNQNGSIGKIKEIYEEFHSKMRIIIKKQSDLIERIAKFSNDIKIENIREKIKNL